MGKPRKAKISVLLNDEELERLERYCIQRGYKKSTLIARLIRDHLDAEQFHVQAKLPHSQPRPESTG